MYTAHTLLHVYIIHTHILFDVENPNIHTCNLSVCQVTVKKMSHTGQLKQTNLLYYGAGDLKSKIKASAHLFSPEVSLLADGRLLAVSLCLNTLFF